MLQFLLFSLVTWASPLEPRRAIVSASSARCVFFFTDISCRKLEKPYDYLLHKFMKNGKTGNGKRRNDPSTVEVDYIKGGQQESCPASYISTVSEPTPADIFALWKEHCTQLMEAVRE